MSLYLLDSSVLITAHRSYYSFDFGNSFWDQLAKVLTDEKAVLLRVVRNELLRGSDDGLKIWLKGLKKDVKFLSEHQNPEIVKNYAKVIRYISECGYYKETALDNWSDDKIADAWLIAAAMYKDAIIVTDEQSAGGFSLKNPHKNAKIPDVAKYFNVDCVSLFDFMRIMNFKL